MLRSLIAAGAALAVLVPASAAEAKAPTCPKRKDTIVVKPLGRVWHQAGGLWACTTVYGHKPKLRRLGPWKPGTKVAFDGVDVAWSVPLVRGGVRSDRLWAANADDGSRWLTGRLAVAPSGDQPEREARVGALRQAGSGIAWTTTTGEVGLALRAPESDPEPFGGLPAPPPAAPKEKRLLVGAFGAAAVPALSASLVLAQEIGEGDECGGSNPYRLSFTTTPGGPAQGVVRWGAWQSTNCR